jgi:hypothetical protein
VKTTDEGRAAARRAEDYEWALQRVTNMRDHALIDAQVYGPKLLKGFGYPDETFSQAQNYRALNILLTECDRRSRAVEALRRSGLDHVVDLPDKHPLRIRAEKAERERDAMRVALQLIDRDDVDETRWDLIQSALASPTPAAENVDA